MSACVGFLALIVAVAVATASLPSYDELARRSDLGQMIRVRAANGTVLVVARPELRPVAALRPDSRRKCAPR